MFADQIQPVARRMPWMTVGGNHERDWPASGDRYGDVLDSGEGLKLMVVPSPCPERLRAADRNTTRRAQLAGLWYALCIAYSVSCMRLICAHALVTVGNNSNTT